MFASTATTAALLYCRPGMEADCAAEIIERAAASEIHGWCRTLDGLVEFTAPAPGDIAGLAAALRFTSLVFPRQWCGLVARAVPLPPSDRAGALVAALGDQVEAYGELRIEHPDSTVGRPLARLAQALREPVRRALTAHDIAHRPGAPTLHIVLTEGQAALIGRSDPANASAWPGGIPRLKLPRQAPSRSVLKLEEALGLFLSDAERAAWLRPGRRAVDLGAAPGGWSWLLLERGLAVEAIDNARLAAQVAEHPRLRHTRTDGFTFRPGRTIDWLVCDMVEQPRRIARLAADWLQRGDCRHLIVNLKLPMKRRWPEVRERLAMIADALPNNGRLSARQLYHDRAEVTVFATRAPLSH